MSTPQTPASLLSVHPMSDAAEIEASEAIADQIEQAWRDDQAAEALADDLGDDAPIGRTATAQQHWQIDGDKTAMWAIGKIHDATEERDRIRRNAQHQIEQIQAKALRDETGSTRTIEFMTGKLIAYRRQLEQENPRLPKTYRLANGDLCVRAGRPSVKVIDESAFVDWASDNRPSALTYKPKVSALKDLDRADDGHLVDPETGEIIPGVVEITADPSYSVKPSVNEEPF